MAPERGPASRSASGGSSSASVPAWRSGASRPRTAKAIARSSGPVRQPGQLLADAPRDLFRPEGTECAGNRVGGFQLLGEEVVEERVEKEGVAAGDGVAGVGEGRTGGRQAIPHDGLDRFGPERAWSDRRCRDGQKQLGRAPAGLRRCLPCPDCADDGELKGRKRVGQLHEPAQRRHVGPMDVVDDEQCRRPFRQAADHPAQAVGGGMHGVPAGAQVCPDRARGACRARAAAPTARSSHSGLCNTGVSNCRAMPHPALCSRGPPRATKHPAPHRSARVAACAIKLDLPIPAGPSTSTMHPAPVRAWARCRSSAPTSPSRSNNTRATPQV